MMRNVLFLVVFVFSAMELSAQTGRSTRSSEASQNASTLPAIVHVDQFLASLQGKSGQSTHVRSLINDLQPSSYAENGLVKSYGDNPSCLFTDVRSFAGLPSLDVPKGTIEMVTIKLSKPADLSTPLDFSVLSLFPRLRYVYLVSEMATTEQKVVALVRNNDPRYSVFYNIPTLH